MEAIIILAGGSGTRLWPASTRQRPKQFLRFGRELSFLQESVERGLAVNPEAEVLVVTHQDYVDDTVSQLARYAADAEISVLPEPLGRNTAPAIAFAAEYLGRRLPESTRALVLSADHLIEPREEFVAAVRKAGELAAEGFIAIFGIPPTEPHTGYGYIEAGEAQGPGFRVRAFREKPDAATAAGYLKTGGFFWNSGMFLFSLAVMKAELDSHAPEISAAFRSLERGTDRGSLERGRRLRGVGICGEGEEVLQLYQDLPSISIDYAVMERSRRAAMVRADFSWTDLGSWDEVARRLPDDSPGTVKIQSSNCSVFSDLPVALCGVEDLVVAVRGGRVLVMKKGASQLVREAALEMDS